MLNNMKKCNNTCEGATSIQVVVCAECFGLMEDHKPQNSPCTNKVECGQFCSGGCLPIKLGCSKNRICHCHIALHGGMTGEDSCCDKRTEFCSCCLKTVGGCYCRGRYEMGSAKCDCSDICGCHKIGLSKIRNEVFKQQEQSIYATKADKRRATKQRKQSRERVLEENDTIADYLSKP